MAQNAKISALTDELVHSILKFDPANSRQAYKHAKELTTRGIRGHQYARTNQFEVTASFAGLDEKFRIRSRDDLADALQLRLQKLDSTTSKFKPEFLSLLLHLADRPLENTKLEALELLRPESPPPPLTWHEILEDDPYSDEDIWKDIDYAGGSSEDEKPLKKPNVIPLSPPTSVQEDDTYSPEANIVPNDADIAVELRSAQFWNAEVDEEQPTVQITELQAVRETLFMLSGLQTSLYQLDKQQENIRLNARYALSHAASETIGHLFSQFISIGQDIYRFRRWTERSSSVPIVQTFQSAVRTRLLLYDQSLAKLQERYLTPALPVAVSLLQLHNDVRVLSDPVLRLAHIVASIEPKILLDPFSPLEALFEQTVLAQMTLESDLFRFMSGIFFDCLQTYLRPIRAWMEAGELGLDSETFFVFENDANSELGSLWHDRYVLRRDVDNKLRAPSFLHPAAKKIFNTGKSIIFLGELNTQTAKTRPVQKEPRLDFASVCGSTDEVPFAPFPELFEAAFSDWMQSKYSHASIILRKHIFDVCGLMRVLDNYETLFLGKNGAAFENFANALFERMDVGRRGWNDRYVLTEIAQDVYGAFMSRSEAEQIVVRSLKAKDEAASVKALAAVLIDFAVPWPVQNIIQRSSVPTYQKLFAFLLQVYRVKYLLQRHRPGRSGHSAQALMLRLFHRLTWFTDVLRSYLTETAIFFTTRDMHSAMVAAEDIDEMAQVHSDCILKLHKRAILSKELKVILEAVFEVLDLGVLLATIASDRQRVKDKHTVPPTQKKQKVPAQAADHDSDSSSEDSEGDVPIQKSQPQSLNVINREFERLLPFVSTGLRNVGRVGAEPMWEQLADRLEWKGKKENTRDSP